MVVLDLPLFLIFLLPFHELPINRLTANLKNPYQEMSRNLTVPAVKTSVL